jgi:hypothetical protein
MRMWRRSELGDLQNCDAAEGRGAGGGYSVMYQLVLQWIAANLVALATIGGGLFAFIRWLSEHRELRLERRTGEYWKLLDIAVGAEYSDQRKPQKAHQVAAIHMLARYPEFSNVTTVTFRRLLEENSPWSKMFEPDVLATLKSIGSS